MPSDFGITRYCKKCGKERVKDGDVVTWTEGMEICECDTKNEGGKEE